MIEVASPRRISIGKERQGNGCQMLLLRISSWLWVGNNGENGEFPSPGDDNDSGNGNGNDNDDNQN